MTAADWISLIAAVACILFFCDDPPPAE